MFATLAVLALAASPAAFALDIPAYVPGQSVYLVPEDYRFPTQQVQAATAETEHPVYVVVYEQVIDGTIEPGHESETEDAIEAVWGEWRTATGMVKDAVSGALDPAEGSLVLLAMDDREVRIVAGSRWDAELSLHNEALGVIIDQHFMPKATASDFDGALADLVRGYDGHVTVELERREQAAREAAARAEREEQERAEAERRRAELAASMKTVAIAAAVVVPVLLVLGLLAFVWLAARGVRRSFDKAAQAMREKLDLADTAFADFRIDVELRDRLVELRLKGPVTLALFQEVTGSLDEIQAGLSGLRRHVEACGQDVKAGAFSVAPWREALERLESRLTIQTAATEGRLFEAPDTEIEVDPHVFMEGLEERFATAREGWQRLLDAVEASLHKAQDDFTRDDLEAMLAALEEAGLPDDWVAEHPLLDDAEGAWAELDELRRSDPVDYLDVLEEQKELDDTLEGLVDEVITGVEAAGAMHEEAGTPSVEGLDTVIDDPARDPAPLADEARQSLEAVLDIATGRQDCEPEAFRAALIALESACEEWLAAKHGLLESIRRAPELVSEAERKLAQLEKDFAASRQRAKEVAREHLAEKLQDAWREIGEAREDLEQMRQLALQARAQLEGRRHVSAETSAEQALAEHGQAVGDLAELTRVLQALEQAKLQAQAAYEALAAQRDTAARELRGYRSNADLRELRRGDDLLRSLESEWRAGVPVDWVARQAAVAAVLTSWRREVDDARRAYRAEQARIAAERAARERREREERRRRERERDRQRRRERDRQRRRSSSSRSSYSSFSKSKRRSSSRSKRSSRSSFSRKRRSGGRKVRRRGRSGGRKF